MALCDLEASIDNVFRGIDGGLDTKIAQDRLKAEIDEYRKGLMRGLDYSLSILPESHKRETMHRVGVAVMGKNWHEFRKHTDGP